MNVYCLIVTDLNTKSSYIEAIYSDEENAEDEREILEADLGEDFVVEVEPQLVIQQPEYNV